MNSFLKIIITIIVLAIIAVAIFIFSSSAPKQFAGSVDFSGSKMKDKSNPTNLQFRSPFDYKDSLSNTERSKKDKKDEEKKPIFQWK